jgi:acyl-CoA reductase-like NAD-dependent aldehyde dehydrogenase
MRRRSPTTPAGHKFERLRADDPPADLIVANLEHASSLTTPSGGMKDSGHGRDRSLHALDSYTQLKTTWISLA